MLRALGVLVIVGGLGLCAPAGAAAQECPAPSIDGYFDPGPIRTDRSTPLTVSASGAARVELAFGDGVVMTARVRDGFARFARAFPAVGSMPMTAVAVTGCEDVRATARWTLEVLPPCSEATDRSLSAEDCDAERGTLAATFGGLATTGNWRTAPCRDLLGQPVVVPPERPTARAAACADRGPRPPGYLPVTRGGRMVLELGAPARSLRAGLGLARATRVPLRGVRRLDRAGRRWAVRTPGLTGRRLVVITAARAGGSDRWVVGVRPARG